jgi:hypothetical protein
MASMKRSIKSARSHYSNASIDRLRERTLDETTKLSSDARRIRELFEKQLTQIKDKKLKSSLR